MLNKIVMWRWIKHQWKMVWYMPSYHFPYGGKEEEWSFRDMLGVALILAGVGFILYLLIHGW